MIYVNKMCQHTSSLLNSHNATMQRCINNSHQNGQLSSAQYSAVKATKTVLRADGHGLHTVNGKMGGILNRLFLHATRPG